MGGDKARSVEAGQPTVVRITGIHTTAFGHRGDELLVLVAARRVLAACVTMPFTHGRSRGRHRRGPLVARGVVQDRMLFVCNVFIHLNLSAKGAKHDIVIGIPRGGGRGVDACCGILLREGGLRCGGDAAVGAGVCRVPRGGFAVGTLGFCSGIQVGCVCDVCVRCVCDVSSTATPPTTCKAVIAGRPLWWPGLLVVAVDPVEHVALLVPTHGCTRTHDAPCAQ